ncbi:MAG: hypothetical protein HY240_06425 [Actinobacteria bacterium]|nr:hypothetical protein [Actinomycetota bacterium]
MKRRRRRLPPQLEEPYAAFVDIVGIAERAKLALTEVVPTTRLPGRPLPDAMIEFEELLREARERMPAWRTPEVEDAWLAAAAGVDASLDQARRLREDAPDLGGFEGLIWAVEELLGPLGAFEGAVERFRVLRTRSG